MANSERMNKSSIWLMKVKGGFTFIIYMSVAYSSNLTGVFKNQMSGSAGAMNRLNRVYFHLNI